MDRRMQADKAPQNSVASDPMQPWIDALRAEMAEFFANKNRAKSGTSAPSNKTRSSSSGSATPQHRRPDLYSNEARPKEVLGSL